MVDDVDIAACGAHTSVTLDSGISCTECGDASESTCAPTMETCLDVVGVNLRTRRCSVLRSWLCSALVV